MDIFAFPGHIFAGHLIPAIPIYLLALLELLRAFQLVPKSQYGTWIRRHYRHSRSGHNILGTGSSSTTSRRKCCSWKTWCCWCCCWCRLLRNWVPGDRTVAWLWMAGAAGYSLFHVFQVLAGHHTSSNSMRNGSHVAMGLCVLFAGLLKLHLSGLRQLTHDYSMALGFGSIAMALIFHSDHDAPELNAMHWTVAGLLLLSSALDLLSQEIFKLRGLYASTLMMASLCLILASDEIVHWAMRMDLGVGPLVVLAGLLSMATVTLVAWRAARKQKRDYDRSTELSDLTSVNASLTLGIGGDTTDSQSDGGGAAADEDSDMDPDFLRAYPNASSGLDEFAEQQPRPNGTGGTASYRLTGTAVADNDDDGDTTV